jgi:hypothetical protein
MFESAVSLKFLQPIKTDSYDMTEIIYIVEKMVLKSPIILIV